MTYTMQQVQFADGNQPGYGGGISPDQIVAGSGAAAAGQLASAAAAHQQQQQQDPNSQQGAVPDHTSFLNGPVVGGGFNTHSKNLQHKMPGAKPVPDDDIEGKGL